MRNKNSALVFTTLNTKIPKPLFSKTDLINTPIFDIKYLLVITNHLSGNDRSVLQYLTELWDTVYCVHGLFNLSCKSRIKIA